MLLLESVFLYTSKDKRIRPYKNNQAGVNTQDSGVNSGFASELYQTISITKILLYIQQKNTLPAKTDKRTIYFECIISINFFKILSGVILFITAPVFLLKKLL